MRYVTIGLVGLAVALVSCSSDNEPVMSNLPEDKPPYWNQWCWDITKEGGGNPTWDFINYAYWVEDPFVEPPILGNLITESEINEDPWVVYLEHYGSGYVGFISTSDDYTYPWESDTGWTIGKLIEQSGFIDGELEYSYAE